MCPPVLTQKLIQDLKDWTTRLFEVADRTLAAVELKEDDHLGFMATLFLRKQVEHLRSIHTLLPRKDVVLVARSMVEGLCQLIWAHEKPERAWRWRAFAYVHDWRLQNLRARQGTRPDPARRDKIEDALRELGESFLTKKAKRARDSGCDLPEDPYLAFTYDCIAWSRDICQGAGRVVVCVHDPDFYDPILHDPF